MTKQELLTFRETRQKTINKESGSENDGIREEAIRRLKVRQTTKTPNIE
jgi:hypothetical protein